MKQEVAIIRMPETIKHNVETLVEAFDLDQALVKKAVEISDQIFDKLLEESDKFDITTVRPTHYIELTHKLLRPHTKQPYFYILVLLTLGRIFAGIDVFTKAEELFAREDENVAGTA